MNTTQLISSQQSVVDMGLCAKNRWLGMDEGRASILLKFKNLKFIL